MWPRYQSSVNTLPLGTGQLLTIFTELAPLVNLFIYYICCIPFRVIYYFSERKKGQGAALCPMADLHYTLFCKLHYTICCRPHWWMVFNYQASHLVVFSCVDLHHDFFPDCVATFLTAVQWLTSCPLSPLCGGQTELCRILNSFQCCVPNPMKCNNSKTPSFPSSHCSSSPLALFLQISPNLVQFWQEQTLIGRKWNCDCLDIFVMNLPMLSRPLEY